MDPPPLPTLHTAPATGVTAAINLNYPDSVESSPRSHTAESFHEPLPPVPGAKLRLMCSYGGHIIPRPHNKSLCYVGGETRMIAIDRHSSLSCLTSRLSRTLVNSRPFTLKYQLPNEELDSLVSVTTDEDLENMIEEYERVYASSSSALAPARIRLFLFFNKPETVASMGSLLDDAKSETWFVDALNGSGLIPRNLSDSATMECLVNLDNGPDLEANVVCVEGVGEGAGENKPGKNDLLQDVHTTLSDAPIVDNNFSSGSSSSSPSMCNLPPIRVRVDDQKAAGIEEQLAQMSFAQALQRKQTDDSYGISCSAPPPVPATIASVGIGQGSSENLNRMVSDDDRSDHCVPIGFRKPPLPLQPVQQKIGACYNLPSPDSVKSDSSFASACSLSKPVYCQDQTHPASRESRAPASPDASTQTSEMHIPQFQDSGHPLPTPLEQQQQQFVHANTHYIPHPATAPVPMQSYYPIYAQPSHHQPHHPIDQQYPVYVMPVPQSQPYMSMQANMADTTSVVASTRPVSTTAGYKDSHPPVYPTKVAATSGKPEMGANLYRTAVPLTPSLVQIPANQFQQQYVGYSQMHHPSQSIAVAPSATANYGYQEYANGTHDQVYYAQHQAAPLPPQYQSMNPAAAVALADASKQLPPNNTMQQIITSQPL